MNRKDKISLIHEGLRQVMAPLWHSSRANIHEIVSEQYGITTSQFHTLRRIMHGRTSVSELADCLHVSQPNVSRAVEELVQKGYVMRERTPEDRRRLSLSLTPAAVDMFNNIHNELDDLLEKNFASLTDLEIDNLFEAIEILKKVTSPPIKE